jgi:hypothetical protein
MNVQKAIRWSLLVGVTLAGIQANAAEVQIPRTAPDKGKYFLLDSNTKNGITTTVHKRVGVNETGYSKTEINCKTMQYRDMGYGEAGPDKLKAVNGRWTDVLDGSSKSDLARFACSRKP